MAEMNSIVAVYATHGEAENGVNELKKSAFNIEQLSIIGKEYQSEEHVVGYYNMGDRMKCWGKRGAFWGGLWGLLVGAAFLVIPGIGPVLVAGPAAAWIIGALEGALVVGGLGAIGAGLYSIGIPRDSVLRYESAVKANKFLLVAHGTPEEVLRAKDILHPTHPDEVNVHFAEEPVRTSV